MAKIESRLDHRFRTDLIGGRVSFSRTDDATTGEPKAYAIVIGGGETGSRAKPRTWQIEFTPAEWAEIVSVWNKPD